MDRGGNVHPYIAQGVAHERIADFLRVAEANQRARDGAEQGIRRRLGRRQRREQARAAALCEAGC
jgi:hypothetical protein